MWISKSATATIICRRRAAAWPPHSRSRQHGVQLLDLERLDDVADLDVLEALDADTAFETLPHFGHVVLEVPQRADLAFVDDTVVPQQANARRPRNHTVDHHAAGDGPRLRHLEGLPTFRASLEDFLELRLQQTGHRRPHLVDQVV